MKRSLFVLTFILFSAASFSQILIGNDFPVSKWVNLGTLSLPQGGNECFIRIVGAVGYNALWWENGNTELYIRTSNWDSVDGNGFGFNASASSYGPSRFISQIKIVPNAPGVSATSYSIYVHIGTYLGGSYFNVEAPLGTFTSVLTNSDMDPGGYDVPFAHFVNNDTFIAGKVGIGTGSADAPLVVNGTIKTMLSPYFTTKNVASITALGAAGITGANNWAIRGVYQYGNGVNLNADGGDLDIIKSLDGNTILGTSTSGAPLGNVAIGTTDPHGFKLAVAGSAIAESMTVKLQANWPDYVFKNDHQLTPLSEVKNYIDQNKHLPEVPSEAEVAKDGINLGEMNKLLLKKVEELTLYLLEQDKQNKEQQRVNASQQQQIDQLKVQLSKLLKK